MGEHVNDVFLNQKARRWWSGGLGGTKKKNRNRKCNQAAIDRIKMEVRPALLSITSKLVSRLLGFFK